jgi:NAD(P)-dependent dehydrogenase (short-subunit alcohol dehydrogenase family)
MTQDTANMLENECIIVTGAGGNLGSVVARTLAQRGAQVICADRSEGHFAAISAGLDPARFLMLGGRDLGNKADVDAVVAAAVAQFGRVTGLVNTVGGFTTGKVIEDALEQWDLMMLLNAKIALITSAAILPCLMETGYGRIVHIAAQPGIKATAGQAAYAASKAAVIRLVETIAAEHRSHRITANCVLPGTIDTPVNRAAMPNAKPDIWIAPQSIADLIAYLVSPAGAVVTGAAIPATALV